MNLQMQIACVEREIRMRESMYPRFIQNARLSPDKAELELASMRAVLDTLKHVERRARYEMPAVGKEVPF